MILAALVVPATMWWMSLRYYNNRRQAERALALERKAQRQSANVKQKHETFFKPLDSGSVEFSPVKAMRTSWNGQTDPDSVWHGQLQQANKTLMEHQLPPLNAGYSPPPTRRIQSR